MIRPTIRCSRSNRPGVRAQAVLEYAILLGVATAAVLGMQLYAKRSIQATIKLTADQLGSQADGIGYEAGERQNKVVAEGRTLERTTTAATTTDRTQRIQLESGGQRTTTISDTTSVTGAVPGEPGLISKSRVVIDVR